MGRRCNTRQVRTARLLKEKEKKSNLGKVEGWSFTDDMWQEDHAEVSAGLTSTSAIGVPVPL